MGFGKDFMEELMHTHHIGHCPFCNEWTALKQVFRGVFTCPMCGAFGSPDYTYPQKVRDFLYAIHS